MTPGPAGGNSKREPDSRERDDHVPPPDARPAARQPPGEATAILTRAVADRLRMRPNRLPRQGSRRVAFALYVLLLVLPTVVLGGLLWNQLERDHETIVASVPADAAHATRRLQEALVQRVEEVVRDEDKRSFLEFRPLYFPPDTIGADIAYVPSPLADGPTDGRILGWFSYRGDDGPADRPMQVLLGTRARHGSAPRVLGEVRQAAQDLRAAVDREIFITRFLRVD